MNSAALIGFAGAALGAALALTAVVRARRSAAHWPFVVGMAILAIEGLCNGLTAKAVSPDMMIHWQWERLLVLAFLPGIWLLFSFNYARGDARISRKRWRWLLVGAFALPVTTAVLFRGSLITSVRWNSIDSLWVLRLGWAGIALYAFLLIGSILVLTNLERTFRAAVGTMRWRIKFMVLGVGVLFAVRIYTSSQALLFHIVELSVENLNSGALLVTSLLIARSLHRTGHFEVDVYPSQSVLQNSITFVVAGIYLVAVGILAKVASYFGASSSFTFNAFLALIAFVALAVILQSDNARLQLRRFVSRNFHRPIYDYRTVWRKFTEGTAAQLMPVEFCRSLVGLLADVFQSLSVAIWLVDDQREVLTLAASTFLSEAKGRDLALKSAETGEVIAYFRENPEPVELESVQSNLAAVLTRIHPREFIAGGRRVCAPLTSQGEVVGLVLVGDRVGGASFTLQDFDMLKCVANHLSASLRNMQLSQKILQTKELEAFQTMAAFFVHDLKNATSTLNLMLQNLPVHFDDPEFRADSLRGISNTATHINRLIERLSLLRRGQSLTLVESDLNEVVAESLAGWDKAAGTLISKNLQLVPKVMLDREQMHKVVTNLILNATEAVSAEGRVRVETGLDPNWVVLTVADNGCGMTAEFVSRGLFRPFQTTKKAGLGIGMFQSKMIVESHGGRITVASEPGHGTTFRVSSRAEAERMKPTLLIVDDDDEIRTQMKWALSNDYDIKLAADRASATELFRSSRPPAVLLDLGLPPHPATAEEGLATLSELIDVDNLVKVIIITGQGEKEIALRAVGAGAYDFLGKPVDMVELKLMLKRCFHIAQLEREYRDMQLRFKEDVFEGMLGTDARMEAVFHSIRKVATTDAPVLILGESGTGKEMAAQAIHHRSTRKDGPFVAINCSAIPESLIESELFGHEKGAFTGAHVQRKGRIESSSGGTLFLDEIGEVPLPLQVKLLRFLQEQRIERVGGRQEIQVDTRVIAATNADLKKGMANGSFREDLFYRIAVVQIVLPPLLERGDDVLLLAQAFLERFAAQSNKIGLTFGPEALKAIRQHSWPGNVRELQNRVKRAVIMCGKKRLTPQDLELAGGSASAQAVSLKDARESIEREVIQNSLRRHSGKIAAAATELGISRPTLYELIAKLGIQKPE